MKTGLVTPAFIDKPAIHDLPGNDWVTGIARVYRPFFCSRMASETSLRILILGHPGVGKSALAVRYLTKRYLGEYISNTDVMYRCMVQAENKRWKLEILDSSNNDTQCVYLTVPSAADFGPGSAKFRLVSRGTDTLGGRCDRGLQYN
ncbi:hypothetical protein RvY_09288-2 [Ramazzottius varieornatus]|uniref:small monomeric GTPase n=1 Tax=Ramazzottius varieornatus TaxID=947166 RepID=A0A1D1V8T1_RAMVA|nr:hypothetical protein RvY_09288-2 [Ramazzottius varieornatus]